MAYSYICGAAAIYICIFNSIFALFHITHQNVPRMWIYCTYGIRWGIWTMRCWHLEYSGGTGQYSACLTRSHRQWRYWQWWVNPKSVTSQCRRILTNANIMARRGLKMSHLKNFVATISFLIGLAALNASIILGSPPTGYWFIAKGRKTSAAFSQVLFL